MNEQVKWYIRTNIQIDARGSRLDDATLIDFTLIALNYLDKADQRKYGDCCENITPTNNENERESNNIYIFFYR